MRLPPIPKRTRYRISTTDRTFMIVVAVFFDTVQLIPKLFILIGMVGALVPIVGWVVGGASVAFGVLFDFVFGFFVSTAGFSSMWVWFECKDVPAFGGTYMERKILMFPAFFILELFVSSLPSITAWTWITIHLSRKEDRETHAKLVSRLQKAHALQARKEVERETELQELTKRVATKAAA